MAPTAQFKGARLKAKRADRHIREFVETIRAFLKTDFCKLHVEQDGNTGRYSIKVDATAEYPPEIPLIIGDAVHNLRSAIDHIVVEFTGREDMGLPAGKERDDVIAKSGAYSAIKQAFPDFADFIVEKIQPYAGGKFKVWELGKLDITDKHKLIIPTVNISSLMGFDVEDERGNRISNSHVAVRQGRVQGFVSGLGKLEIHNHGQAGINIHFGPGTPFQDQPVLETLTDLHQLTVEVIEAFELFCFGQIADPDADSAGI